MTVVAPDRFSRLMRKIEGLADVAGWDAFPAAYVVYDLAEAETAAAFDYCMARHPSLGPPVKVGGYAAQQLIAGAWFIRDGIEPATALTNFALNLAYADSEPDIQQMIGVLRRPGVLGFAFCYEGYGSLDMQNAPRVLLGEFDHVSDLPDAEEGRVVQGHDVQNRQYRVTRRRGHPAELDTSGSWRGDFVTAVALLCDVIAGTVPPQADFRVKYPTLRQLVLEGRFNAGGGAPS